MVAGLASYPGSCPRAWMRTHGSTVTVAVRSGGGAGGTWGPPLSSGDAHCGMNTPRKTEMKQLKDRLSGKKSATVEVTFTHTPSYKGAFRVKGTEQADEERRCDRDETASQRSAPTTGLRPRPNRLSACIRG